MPMNKLLLFKEVPLSFQVSTVFGTYEIYIDTESSTVQVDEQSTDKSITIEFSAFEDVNPNLILEREFGGGCRAIHLRVREAINDINRSEPEQGAHTIVDYLNAFYKRHQYLTIFLAFIGTVIALVGLVL